MSDFAKELEQLLNKFSIENGSNTPDWILANYVRRCLDAWNATIVEREAWYGREFSPGTIGLSPVKE